MVNEENLPIPPACAVPANGDAPADKGSASAGDADFAPVVPEVLVLSRPDELASVVLASAVLEPTRKALPNTKLYLLVREQFAGLFCDHPALDGIIFFDEKHGLRALVKQLKAVGADSLAHLSYSEFVSDAANLAKIRNVAALADDIGNDDKSGVTLEVTPSAGGNDAHEGFFNFEALVPFGVNVPDKPQMALSPDPAARETAHEKLAEYGIIETEYAVFCLDGNALRHYVAPAVFAHAADFLRKIPLPIIVVGEKSQESTMRFLDFCRKTHGTHIIDLRGRTSPEENAWILAEARLCFSGENACAYIAAAENCPLVALFVDFAGNRWFPLGYLTTNIFTGAHRKIYEPRALFNYRVSRAFGDAKIDSALQFALSLREV